MREPRAFWVSQDYFRAGSISSPQRCAGCGFAASMALGQSLPEPLSGRKSLVYEFRRLPQTLGPSHARNSDVPPVATQVPTTRVISIAKPPR